MFEALSNTLGNLLTTVDKAAEATRDTIGMAGNLASAGELATRQYKGEVQLQYIQQVHEQDKEIARLEKELKEDNEEEGKSD